MRYKFWNKQEPIYTRSGEVFTAEEFMDAYGGWARNPNTKAIIVDSAINGGVFMEFGQTKETYQGMGMEIPEGTTDEGVLRLMEQWDSRPQDTSPSPEERIAAAMEYQAMSSLPVDMEDPALQTLRSVPTGHSDQWEGDPTILMNFLRRLWHWKQVKMLIGRTITHGEFVQLMRMGVENEVISQTVFTTATGEIY